MLVSGERQANKADDSWDLVDTLLLHPVGCTGHCVATLQAVCSQRSRDLVDPDSSPSHNFERREFGTPY